MSSAVPASFRKRQIRGRTFYLPQAFKFSSCASRPEKKDGHTGHDNARGVEAQPKPSPRRCRGTRGRTTGLLLPCSTSPSERLHSNPLKPLVQNPPCKAALPFLLEGFSTSISAGSRCPFVSRQEAPRFASRACALRWGSGQGHCWKRCCIARYRLNFREKCL